MLLINDLHDSFTDNLVFMQFPRPMQISMDVSKDRALFQGLRKNSAEKLSVSTMQSCHDLF